MQTLFTSGDTQRLTGVSLRQLTYWDQTGIVRPHASPAKGHGSRRLYTFEDLVQIKVLLRLKKAGLSLHKIRAALALVRAMVDEPAPLAELEFLGDGRRILVRRSSGDIVDPIAQHYVLRLPISELLHEVKLELASMAEPATSSGPSRERAGGVP